MAGKSRETGAGDELRLPLAGMRDMFGLELRRRHFVTARLAQLCLSCGYEQLELPLIERATSFAEEVVGRSPWPEWDQRGCFYIDVADYSGSYDSQPTLRPALLVPEGTISVTRWLGQLLADDARTVFPLKIFYETPCFRNELVTALDSSKRRQFTQFGVEILGADAPSSDTEALYLISAALRALGVPANRVLVRIGDVAIFNRLVKLSGIDADTAIEIKEALDALAECKAGKLPGRRAHLVESVARRTASLPERWRAVWSALMRGERASTEVVAAVGDATIDRRLAALHDLATVLGTIGVTATLDVCVVRSHEYYTGIAFEIDVLGDAEAFVEIGGGGRYDKLVGHFTPAGATQAVPATGFAFGVERLVRMLDALRLLELGGRAERTIELRASSADVLLVPAPGMRGYGAAVAAAERERMAGRSADVYVGSPGAWKAYAAARGIGEVRAVDTNDPAAP